MADKIDSRKHEINPPTGETFNDAIATVRKAYRIEVKRIAESLALQFRARKFDNTAFDISLWKEAGPWDLAVPPFDALESLCEQMPICRDERTARMVIAASKYGRMAPSADDLIDAPPFPDHMWKVYAAWCLARDLHDHAMSRGWAHSRFERYPPEELDELGKLRPQRHGGESRP